MRETVADTEKPFLSVVIPAYNESSRLPATLEKIIRFLETKKYSSEIIVVDDGSEDSTVEETKKFAALHSHVSIIANPHLGKGATVKTGVLKAKGEIILFSDADLSTPIEETDKLIPHFDKGYDIVIGSREGQGSHRHDEPYYRHVMGRVFNYVVQLVAVRGIKDTQCGFKAFKKNAAHDLFNRMQLYTDNKVVKGNMVTAFDVEILFLALKKGYAVKEVPIQWHYYDETKVHPFRDSWRNFKDVLKVRLKEMKGEYN